ncbi:MAG: hypothetical protein KA408_15485 [Flavobacteriales bacterium]|nr:hypothetical protein [Flavobacteriales bacterium]
MPASSIALSANTCSTDQHRSIFAPLAYHVKLNFVAALVVIRPSFRLAIAVGYMELARQAFLACWQGEE